MSLNARDRQTLSLIEHELAGSDPRLADLLDGFSQRMAGQEMPTSERSRAGWRCLARPHRFPGPSWLPTMLVLWVLLIGTVVGALAASHIGGRGPCSTGIPTQCAVHTGAPH